MIGHPIAHSRSPLIHGHWLAEFGIQGSYERIDVSPSELASFIGSFADRGYVGGNVSIPHKEVVFHLVDEMTDLARRVGAVNTIWYENGRLIGHNTDAGGFTAGLDDALGAEWGREVRGALVCGAGGASRAVLVGLLERNVERIVLANRGRERALALAAIAPDRIQIVPLEETESLLREIDLVVNATSLGMVGQPALPLRLDRLGPHAMVTDIVYAPLETPLLAAARARGLRTANGLGMLLHQAAPGFEAWFGVAPRVTPALRALIEADVERTG